jgi:hypothetical protein
MDGEVEDWDVQLGMELEDGALRWCAFVRARERAEAVAQALSLLRGQIPSPERPDLRWDVERASILEALH